MKEFIVFYRPRIADRPPNADDAWVHVSFPQEEPFEVEIKLALRDGRLVCTALRIGEMRRSGHVPEITAKSLREIPLGAILEQVADDLGVGTGEILAQVLGVAHLLRAPAPVAKEHLRPGPQGYDRAFFAEIAELYREALVRRPGSPYTYMRARRPGSLPTQRRWVQRARDMGLLGPAQPGKAGESPKEPEPSSAEREQ
ncbi:MAG: hypothetical protein ACLQUT_03570 [Thermoleophilia bacterium]